MPGTVPAIRQLCTMNRRNTFLVNKPDKIYCSCFINTQGGARERIIFADEKAAYVCHRNQSKRPILFCPFSVTEREWQNQTWWVISEAWFRLVLQEVWKFKCVNISVCCSGFIHVLWMLWGAGTMICRLSGWVLQNS